MKKKISVSPLIDQIVLDRKNVNSFVDFYIPIDKTLLDNAQL